jgi:CRP-like cAMP-binding protein
VEGGEALECYVISEGEAQVTIGGELVRTVREYDVVGERGLLEKRARTATVTADSEMISYAISRERLAAVLDKNPKLAEAMLAYTRERYAD